MMAPRHAYLRSFLIALLAAAMTAGAATPVSAPGRVPESVLPGGAEPDAVVIEVSVPRQEMLVFRGGQLVLRYKVSTATAGVGARENSGRTPPGWHRVSEWIGGDAVPGQVFVSREPIAGSVLGKDKWRDDRADDFVLTRVMWLDGMEPGVNRGRGIDSHDRFIYIHGTNQEHLLGRPASHGCIRMSNRDVMELYYHTFGHPTYVNIVE